MQIHVLEIVYLSVRTTFETKFQLSENPYRMKPLVFYGEELQAIYRVTLDVDVHYSESGRGLLHIQTASKMVFQLLAAKHDVTLRGQVHHPRRLNREGVYANVVEGKRGILFEGELGKSALEEQLKLDVEDLI